MRRLLTTPPRHSYSARSARETRSGLPPSGPPASRHRRRPTHSSSTSRAEPSSAPHRRPPDNPPSTSPNPALARTARNGRCTRPPLARKPTLTRPVAAPLRAKQERLQSLLLFDRKQEREPRLPLLHKGRTPLGGLEPTSSQAPSDLVAALALAQTVGDAFGGRDAARECFEISLGYPASLRLTARQCEPADVVYALALVLDDGLREADGLR